MKKIIRRRLILLLGLAFCLIMPLAGCIESETEDEAYNYLSEMQTWHSEWERYEERFLKPFTDPDYDLLLGELANIELPAVRIPQRLEGSCSEIIYPPRDHKEYLDAHRLYLTAQRHMETMQQLEEERFRGRDDDTIPDCDIVQDIDVSQQYRETCSIKNKALENLVRVRDKWDAVFREYFPERYEQ